MDEVGVRFPLGPQFMQKNNSSEKKIYVPAPSLSALLLRYIGIVSLLIVLTIIANALSVYVPQIISSAIDTYTER